MKKNIHSIFVTIILSLVALTAAACGSSSEHENPVITTADKSIETESGIEGPSTNEHTHPWGAWNFHIGIDPADGSTVAEAVPIRSGESHWDITGMLLPASCSNCLSMDVLSIEGEIWTVMVELTNPTTLSGYSVRGIFPGSIGPSVLYPDSYTDLYDVDSNSKTHHPFIYFETGHPDREWGPGESHSHIFNFLKQDGEEFVDFIYLAAADWPGEQQDVSELKNMSVSGPLYSDTSNTVNFNVQAVDFQGDIEYVIMDLTPLNGSAFTHMTAQENGWYQISGYTEWGLEVGTYECLIAAKSMGATNITYNYLEVSVTEPPEPPTYFDIYAGPVELKGDGAPSGELDLAVSGDDTMMYSTSTDIYVWNPDYSASQLLVSILDPSGTDTQFPVDPVLRLAASDPVVPGSTDKYSLISVSGDTDTYDNVTEPNIPYSDTVQLLDMEQLLLADFTLKADNPDTEGLDVFLRCVDVSSGTSGDKSIYALWVPDGGAYPLYFPYIVLVRYEYPYVEGSIKYYNILGGIMGSSGEGKIKASDINGIAVWDSGGDSNIILAVSEGGLNEEVEFFSIDYTNNPGGEFTHLLTMGGFVGTPLDVAILPVADEGIEDENWICVLTDSKTIEVHEFDGGFVESIFSPDFIPYQVKHLDSDIANLRLHVTMQGPYVTVIEYTGL
jgi:hypothetical protein